MRRTIVVLASMLLAAAALAASLGSWATHHIVDERAFVDAALESFQSDGSDDALGELVAAKVVERSSDLAPFEPALATLLAALITTDPFAPLRVGVSGQIHAAVLDGERGPVVVDLGDHRSEILSSVSAISPELADRIPDDAFSTFVIFERDALPDASGPAEFIVAVGWISIIAVVVLVVLLVLVSRSVVTSFVAIGTALVVPALVTAMVVTVARGTIDAAAPNGAYAVLGRNLFDVLVGPMVGRAWLMGIIAAVMVGAALVVGVTKRRRTAGQP